MCSCASLLSFPAAGQNTFRSKPGPMLTDNCCQNEVTTKQETKRQEDFYDPNVQEEVVKDKFSTCCEKSV